MTTNTSDVPTITLHLDWWEWFEAEVALPGGKVHYAYGWRKGQEYWVERTHCGAIKDRPGVPGDPQGPRCRRCWPPAPGPARR